MNEIWKNIEGYEGLYQISDMGRVRSLNYNRTGRTRIKAPFNNGKGYLAVQLSKNGEIKNFYVHRLVAEAFLPNPRKWPEINHKNEVKSDNVVSNLEWCSSKYNSNYGTGLKRMAATKSKPVLQFDADGNLVKTWLSTREIERQLGFYNSYISKCCLGKWKSAYGYVWKYC